MSTTRQKHFICNECNLPGHSAHFHLHWKLSHAFTYNLSANANVFHKVKSIKLLGVTMHACTHIQTHKSHTLLNKTLLSSPKQSHLFTSKTVTTTHNPQATQFIKLRYLHHTFCPNVVATKNCLSLYFYKTITCWWAYWGSVKYFLSSVKLCISRLWQTACFMSEMKAY
jgi:hypothetical protein